MAIAFRSLEVVKTLLMETEHRDFMEEIYAISLEEFRRYDADKAMERRRLHPLETPREE